MKSWGAPVVGGFGQADDAIGNTFEVISLLISLVKPSE
jgi:hypothetical protein